MSLPGAALRVTIIDDHAVLRDGLQRLIEGESGLSVCCRAGTAEAGLACIRDHRPDLCLMDISMPGISGIEAIGHVLAIHPGCRVVVLSMYDEAVYAMRALRAGAMGYVMKSEPSENVVAALRCAARGEVHLSPVLQGAVLRGLVGGQGEASGALATLSVREFEIVHLMGQGFSAAQIAARLHRSVKTIDVHRQNIKRKLGLPTTAKLVQYAVRWAEAQKTL